MGRADFKAESDAPPIRALTGKFTRLAVDPLEDVGKNLSLPAIGSGETAADGRLLFLVGGLFGRNGQRLLVADAAGLGVFLRGFLLICFRGPVTHNFIPLLSVC
jgi:hypothetical protein